LKLFQINWFRLKKHSLVSMGTNRSIWRGRAGHASTHDPKKQFRILADVPCGLNFILETYDDVWRAFGRPGMHDAPKTLEILARLRDVSRRD
jgi:hypothetical protein